MITSPDISSIRKQFPILSEKVNGNKLVYFDNGATTQKPERVLQAMNDFYRSRNANIHRGVHTLSRLATEAYEDARKIIAAYFNVNDPSQIVFTAGTTDSINIVAEGLGKTYFRKGDEILLSAYEHHSNILPWQLLAEERGLHLKVIPLLENQSLDLSDLATLINARTRLIAIAQVSNTLGLISDLKKISGMARKNNIPILIDGAQSAPHMQVDLTELDVDFFACSAHKMYGPTGTGILYMSARWLNDLSQSRTGGGTIKTVSFEKTEYVEGALRFEPGTPNIAGAIGFAEALRFMKDTGIDFIAQHEHELIQHAQKRLKEIPEVIVYGQSAEKAAVLSFNVKHQHPFDVGTLLDKYGIAVRTGHHCTQPLMSSLNIQGTVRISFAVYNTIEEIDFFIEKLKKVVSMLS